MKNERIRSTLFGRLVEQADITPDKCAVASGGGRLSYAGLLERVLSVAGCLRSLGVNSGDRICLARLNKTDFWTSVLACFALKAVAVPQGEKIDAAFAAVAADCGARCVIGSNADAPLTDPALNPQILPVTIEDALTGPAFSPEDHGIAGEEVAAVFYTSGTSTGRKKGVRVTHENLYATEAYLNLVMGVNDEIVEYVIAPINHAFGFGRLRAVLRVGGTIVFDNGIFNPAKALLAMKNHECNAISSVSTGFVLLLDKFGPFLKDIAGQIRWIEIGSLPLPTDYKRRMLEIFSAAKICMNYGLTEAMRSTLLDLRENPDKLQSVGSASPGVEIVIMDVRGRILPPEEKGEICVRGVNVAHGYWGMADLWQERTASRWFHTGDHGYLDQDGFLHFLGRSDDVINVGGIKVCPLELEQRLAGRLNGTSFCVCGMNDPDGLLHEIPVLCIEGGSASITLDLLEDYLAGIEPAQRPRKIVSFDALPRTENGKIRRNQLKKILNREAG